MEKSCRCDICNTDVHKASYTNYLLSTKHLGNISQDDILMPEWLFKEEQTLNRKKKLKKYITLKHWNRLPEIILSYLIKNWIKVYPKG